MAVMSVIKTGCIRVSNMDVGNYTARVTLRT